MALLPREKWLLGGDAESVTIAHDFTLLFPMPSQTPTSYAYSSSEVWASNSSVASMPKLSNSGTTPLYLVASWHILHRQTY